MDRFRVTASSLNVRAEPRLEAPVIAGLDRGTVVDGLGISADGQWVNVRRADGVVGWASQKFLVSVANEVPTGSEEFPWMPIALQEQGIKEVPGAGDHPRIVQYLKTTTLSSAEASNDETFWCSAFVNFCVEQAGYEGTDSARARSWAQWGQAIEIPRRGCIAVFRRDQPGNPGAGHVGFFVEDVGRELRILSGNQSDAVNIQKYPKSDLLGYRVPVNHPATEEIEMMLMQSNQGIFLVSGSTIVNVQTVENAQRLLEQGVKLAMVSDGLVEALKEAQPAA